MCSKKALIGTVWYCWSPLGTPGWLLNPGFDPGFDSGFDPGFDSGCRWAPLDATRHICANFTTCSSILTL